MFNIRKTTALSLGTALLLLGTAYGAVTPESTPITFAQLANDGLYSQILTSVTPDLGCLKIYDLKFPEFSKGVLNRARNCSWTAGYLTGPSTFTSFSSFGNLDYNDVVDDRFYYAFDNGYYLLLQLDDGRYLAVLPLVSDNISASVTVYEGVPRLKLCTFGTDSFTGEAPLFAWAFADDPYSATQKCWEHALASDFCKDNIQWRSDKKYPELYEYLGWCTWEAFGGKIDEANVTQSIQDIKSGSVPVRWVIVDDGYLDTIRPDKGGKPQIRSFGVNEKFPNGWGPITSLKEESTVKWIGIWRNMSGGMGGVSPDHTMTNLTGHLMQKTAYKSHKPEDTPEEEVTMIVKPDVASSTAFYEEMIGNTLNGGFDFVKVDFQTYNFWMYAGTGNAVNSAHQNNQALEDVCKTNGVPLLNCISQSNVNVFNTKHSVLSRTSVDIKLDNLNMSRTCQSFANNMWWGEILIGDLDMYHTGNAETAQYLTVARAVSGGPVYISDEPTHFEADVIAPVIFNDGKVIRALAPAVPLADSLFSDGDKACYRVIAPTRHKSCAIASFNFTGDATQSGSLSAADYPYAAAKEQPFNGMWSIPAEGLVVFDQEAQTGSRLSGTYTYSVDRLKGKIFTLAPITNGWAVVGRSDKYLGGCTYTIDSCTATQLELTLDEAGPFVVYHETHIPESTAGSITDLGSGFYRINLTPGETAKVITVTLGSKQR